MGETEIAEELLREYRRAEYLLPMLGLVLRVDERCEALVGWGRPGFAFVTAWNPRSEARSEEENRAADARMRAELAGYELVDAVGTDPDGASSREDGVLVRSVGREEAIEVGRQFGQNAILWAGEDAVVRLVLLR